MMTKRLDTTLPRRKRRFRQFSLRGLFEVSTACCVLLAAVGWLGIKTVGDGVIAVLIGVTIFLILTAWSYAYVKAPEAVKYGTIGLFMAMLLFNLFALGVLQSTEQARILRAQHRLQQLGRQQLPQSPYAP